MTNVTSTEKDLMIAPVVTTLSLPAPAMPPSLEDFSGTLPLIELELSLEGFSGGEAEFAAAVRDAAEICGGAFLFDLPGADLLDDCSRVAVVRIGDEPDQPRTVLALLDEAGAAIRIEDPDERTEGLVRLADAFVGVLEKI